MDSGNGKFEVLRAEYPLFVYRAFDYRKTKEAFHLSFHFAACDAEGGERHVFRPRLLFPMRAFYHIDRIPEEELRKLVFHCGMVELVSYWKCVCSPLVRIECGELGQRQVSWFRKLYFNGLGEFFYLNGIAADADTFMQVECCPVEDSRMLYRNASGVRVPANGFLGGCSGPSGDVGRGPGLPGASLGRDAGAEGILVPVGGGKDSVVALEVLKKKHAGELRPLVVNSRGATRTCCIQAGFSDEDCVLVDRKIDKHLLELNAQGYLNGHTPFSAMLAFVTLLASAFTGYRHIALSNENSANESTVRGSNVNHQYSKSLEFENDFREYVRTYIGSEYDYFSFLRPLNEIGIARLFASIPLYHSLFRSCNAGSKTDSWCGKCPKCLFAFIILCPFLGIGKTSLIFGKNLLDDMDLQGFLDELCGKAAVKPFECVGTVDEVNWSLRQLRAYAAENALLQYYFGIPEGDASEGNDNVRPAVPAGDGDALLEGFSSENNVPEGLLSELKEAVAEVRLWQDADSETGHLIRNPLPDTVCGAFRPFFGKAGPIAVLGFGREGQSTYRFIRKLLPAKEICVIDRNEAVRSNPLLTNDKAVRFLTGDAYLEDFAVQMRSGAFGIVMKTPGISLKDYPDLLASPLLSSQADLFLRVYAPQVIGITGTKGKSTTTMLAYHLLSASRPCLLAGNMGLPFFEILDEIGPGTWIVGEFSAHQLEQVRRAPRIGVLLNLYEEHLDHYRSYRDYREAKLNIAGIGAGGDGTRDLWMDWLARPEAREGLGAAASGIARRAASGDMEGAEALMRCCPPEWPEAFKERYAFSGDMSDSVFIYGRTAKMDVERRFPAYYPGSLEDWDFRCRYVACAGEAVLRRTFLQIGLDSSVSGLMDSGLHVNEENVILGQEGVVFDLSQPHPLIGQHNVRNLLVALVAAHSAGVPYKELAGRIVSFRPLPHRLEYVGCAEGIHYFNDSISTIPQSTMAAVEALSGVPYVQGVDTLIVGGFDRGIDYKPLEDFLRHGRIRNVAFTGKAGRRILQALCWRAVGGKGRKPAGYPDWVAGGTGVLRNLAGKVLVENFLVSDDYGEIVAWAKRVTRPGFACLLSPAAASYDRFKNFEERGEVFKRLVLKKDADI